MKNRINDAYNSITPIRSDDEIIKSVIGKVTLMEKKTIRFRKPLIAVCASITALGLGITAAAATGLIDFNALFGGRIIAHNENVNDELLAEVSNIVVNSGSDEYTLELGGVISTGNFVAGSFELVRTDGAPVADFLYDIDTSKRFDSNQWWSWLYDDNGEVVDSIRNDSVEHYLGFVLNDDGNIDCNFHFNAHEIVSQASKANITFSANWIKRDEEAPFTMSIAFDYAPAEKALQTKEIVIDSNTMEINDGAAEVMESRFDCLSGSFTLEYPSGEEGFDLGETVTLILNDGSEKPIYLCSMTNYHYLDKGTEAETFNFVYSSELDGNITAININDIVAVSLDGTVFDLV